MACLSLPPAGCRQVAASLVRTWRNPPAGSGHLAGTLQATGTNQMPPEFLRAPRKCNSAALTTGHPGGCQTAARLALLDVALSGREASTTPRLGPPTPHLPIPRL